MRRFDEALLRTRKLLELEPGSYYGHWASGDILAATGKYNEAISAYQEALHITPQSAGMIGGSVMHWLWQAEKAKPMLNV